MDILVNLKYINNFPSMYKIKTFSTTSKPFYIGSENAKSLVKKNKNIIYILKTNKGFLTNYDILKYKTGGILIAYIK